jgi:hypothetical protein
MTEKDPRTSARKLGDSRLPPVTIPGVRLGVQLGFGGMATVYEGWDDGFNPPRRVAIKLMNTELSADSAFRARFEREASLVADFRHDNIVHVYASGEAAGIKYIVMEYLGGGTLAERLLKGKLSPGEALKHAAVLAGALAYSHKRDIVHRDVKPANVLFTADGKPILSDFGVAKASSSSLGSALTQQASVVGAPRYMAPEQELGDHVSDRADVYSLGLTLYEMLTGEPPSAAVRLQRIVDETNHFADLLPSLPTEATELLHRCLQLDPAARPSAAEFSRQLHSAAARLTGGRATDVTAPPADKSRRGGMGMVIGGGLAAVLLAGLAVLWTYPPGPRLVYQPSAGTATAAVPVDIQRTPPSAKLYLDGKLLTQTRIALAPGTHRLIAVAPGYYGQLQTVQIAPPAATVTIGLQPAALPSPAQYERFLDLADAPTITAADRDSVGEQTLKLALNTKLLRQNHDLKAVEDLERDLQALAEAGDARAIVVMLLDPAIQAGRIAPTTTDERLLLAADGGDAMASFFAALVLRSQLQSADPSTAATAELHAYCARLQQAAKQGWQQVAAEYLQRDGCG